MAHRYLRYLQAFFFASLIIQCSIPQDIQNHGSLIEQLRDYKKIPGKKEYLRSPFVAAGDRVYLVGHQDGSFPDLGWHIEGEMGGLWDHPIKLMDGFSMNLKDEMGLDWCLDSADSFTNYPFGNLHSFSRKQLSVKRFQFVPEEKEGLIVEYRIGNTSNKPIKLELNFTGHVDLRPTWLAERENIKDGVDEGTFDESINGSIVKDARNPWFVVFGTLDASKTSDNGCKVNRKGNGMDFSIKNRIQVEPNSGKAIQYFIAGSYQSRNKLLETLEELRSNPYKLLDEKIKKYEKLNTTNRLTTNNPKIDKMYRWIKYNTQWLVRDVPEFGRGVSAGIPDYPWWFGTDSAYILQGLVSAGFHQEALSTIDLIMNFSRKENGNGRIVHEVSSNGIVFNPGNLNTTPSFIAALWKVYEWTGNKRIIDEYYKDVVKGVEWIESMDEDQNGYPDGAGMMEIHGLHSEMIDVVAYLAKAYEAASNFAEIKGDNNAANSYKTKAQLLIDKIDADWWVEESNSYADFRSLKEEAMELVDAAIVRADTINKPWSVVELKQTRKRVEKVSEEELQGFVVHHNWVVNTPIETGLATKEKAIKALKTAKNYQNRFGMFVTGIDRQEDQEEATKWKAFSYVGAVMTLPTGVQAISEATYGDSDDALKYLNMLENSFSYALPGSMYEVSPDFGMIAQGWNIYAVAVPIVDHFFGIKPKAYEKQITISPQMPTTWHNAKLENVKIGNNELSITFIRVNEKETYEINQKLDWKIIFDGTENQTAIIN